MALKFTDAEYENGAAVSYAEVDDDTAGGYVLSTSNGQEVHVNAGQVLVKTGRPDVYDVVDSVDALGLPAAPVESEDALSGGFADGLPDDEAE